MLQGWLDDIAGVTGVGVACSNHDGCSGCLNSTNAEMGGETLPMVLMMLMMVQIEVWEVGK